MRKLFIVAIALSALMLSACKSSAEKKGDNYLSKGMLKNALKFYLQVEKKGDDFGRGFGLKFIGDDHIDRAVQGVGEDGRGRARRHAGAGRTILGRTDDVINVAGHRLGTREIEEAIQNHPAIAEVAVVGVEDKLKGQMPMAFAVVKDPSRTATPESTQALEKEVMGTVDGILGAIARPGRVYFVSGLPKTRSGKMLRRSLQALAEGRDVGDLPTIEDASTLEQIKKLLAS